MTETDGSFEERREARERETKPKRSNSSTTATEIIARTDLLAVARSGWDREWREVADYCLPTSSREMMVGSWGMGARNRNYDRIVDQPSTRDAARKRYDSTAISALDRLAAGMESLVAPQSEKWHEQGLTDPLAPEPTDQEAKWLERLRDYQFNVRYTPLSGFANANQKYIRSICAFGTGILFTEEAFGGFDRDQRQLPAVYQHIPISQALISLSAQDNPDTLHRRFAMTARQLVQRFGEDKVSAKVKAAEDDYKRCDEKFEIIHAVCPREEAGSNALGGTIRRSPWASYYVEVEGGHLIGDSGFFEFPFAIGYWIQPSSSAYGESPCMAALDAIRGLSLTNKGILRSTQQWTDPPLGIYSDGVMNRPNLNPRAINYGAVDAAGNLRIKPILTAQDPGRLAELIDRQRQEVKELLYNNLFQILIQNPQMTAHEAMLRAAEKGDLLGPNGVKIQQGYATMSDREVGVLSRKGAFAPGAALEAPQSIQGRAIGARFTSTLDRLRQMKEATGILTTYQAAGQIASVRGNQNVFDNLDDDESIKIISDVNGAPKSIWVNKDDRDAKRQAREQAAAQQANLAAAESAARTAKDAAPAANEIADLKAKTASQGQPNLAPLPLPALAPPPPAANPGPAP